MKSTRSYIISFLIISINLAYGDEPLVILNEYNAVSEEEFLTDGNFDPAFGPEPMRGNGGSWFELLVVGSDPQAGTVQGTTVDMRGWRLAWRFVASASKKRDLDERVITGELRLSGDPIWAAMRSGTLITFTALNTASGGMDTNVSWSPQADNWHINIWTGDAKYLQEVGGRFITNHRDWQLTIIDNQGNIVFGPAGEGINPEKGVGKDEVWKLEEISPLGIDPIKSVFLDGGTSSFGRPNQWSGAYFTQDLSVLRAWVNPDSQPEE